jgi:uncharacterized membrane protein
LDEKPLESEVRSRGIVYGRGILDVLSYRRTDSDGSEEPNAGHTCSDSRRDALRKTVHDARKTEWVQTSLAEKVRVPFTQVR